MQGQDTQKTGNVVSLFARRQKSESAETAQADASQPEPDKDPNGESFEDVMARNAKNKERMEKERNSANKSVLRSYRIKH
jgi:hypothetical protein